LGNEICQARLEAETTLDNKKLDAATKRHRIEGIHTRLTQSLVFTLGVIMMEARFLDYTADGRDYQQSTNKIKTS
jgi:hypothetical protein